MKLFFAIFLLTALTIVCAEPIPAEEKVEELQTEVAEDADRSIERTRRSNLMAQILYDELRLKLRGDQMKSSYPTRRVASASVMRKRRSTTPLKELLQSLAAGSDGVLNNDLEHNNEVADELESEIRTLSRRLMKRSLMAMILKDTLKQRLEDENKPGRHREIVWGKATRNYGRKTPSHQLQLARLLPQLTEAMSELETSEEQHHYHLPASATSSEADKHPADEIAPISILIRPKVTGKAASVV